METLQAIQVRHQHAPKKEKARMLNEVVALAQCHRKHAIGLLAKSQKLKSQLTHVGRRAYDEVCRVALLSLQLTISSCKRLG